MTLLIFRCSREHVLWWGLEMLIIDFSLKWVPRFITYKVSGPHSTASRHSWYPQTQSGCSYRKCRTAIFTSPSSSPLLFLYGLWSLMIRGFVMKTVIKKSLFLHPGIKVCSAVLSQIVKQKKEKKTQPGNKVKREEEQDLFIVISLAVTCNFSLKNYL